MENENNSELLVDNDNGSKVNINNSTSKNKYVNLNDNITLNNNDYSSNTTSYFINVPTGNHDNIKSNLKFVTEHMTNINQKVNSTISMSQHKESEFKRSDSYQQSLNECMNKYFDINNKLLDIIQKEAAASVSYAETIDELDKDIAKRAGEL